MITLISDEELCGQISEYNHAEDPEVQYVYSSVQIENEIKVIKVGIWESEMNHADIVVSCIKNSDGVCVLVNNKVFKVCSFDMEEDTSKNVKLEGLRIKKMLAKNFKKNGIRVTSDLRYSG